MASICPRIDDEDAPFSLPSQVDLNGLKIAIFGLSANPPTGNLGHLGVVKQLSAKSFDEIWILPVYVHMFTTKKLESYEHRLFMCQKNFESVSNEKCVVRVLALEKIVTLDHIARNPDEKNPRVGTIDIIRYIDKHYDNLDLSLILGMDTFNDLAAGKWKESIT